MPSQSSLNELQVVAQELRRVLLAAHEKHQPNRLRQPQAGRVTLTAIPRIPLTFNHRDPVVPSFRRWDWADFGGFALSGFNIWDCYRDPVVPPQKVRLDPPGTHPSPTFSEGTTGSLGFLFLSALAFWPLTTRILLPPTGPYSHPRNPTHTLLLEEIRSVFIRLQIRCRSDSRSIQHLLPGKYVG